MDNVKFGMRIEFRPNRGEWRNIPLITPVDGFSEVCVTHGTVGLPPDISDNVFYNTHTPVGEGIGYISNDEAEDMANVGIVEFATRGKRLFVTDYDISGSGWITFDAVKQFIKEEELSVDERALLALCDVYAGEPDSQVRFVWWLRVG